MAGFIGGLIGIGGAIIIIPFLIYLCHFSQLQAQGTSVFLLLPPIGIAAVINYYKNKNVDLKAAAFIAIGFVVFCWLGAKTALYMNNIFLKKIFGSFLIILSMSIWFKAGKNAEK